jgi:hypothetical protein
MTTIQLRGDPSKLLWSDKSPDAGEPTCLCSACGAWIPETACPLRLTDSVRNLEVRFCDECAETWLGIKTP